VTNPPCTDPLVCSWWADYQQELAAKVADHIPPSFAEYVSRRFVMFVIETGHRPPVSIPGIGEDVWRCDSCGMWTPGGGSHMCAQAGRAGARLTDLPRPAAREGAP
jgi:hypothetical protein